MSLVAEGAQADEQARWCLFAWTASVICKLISFESSGSWDLLQCG